jgi:hypothetical protein
MSYCKCSGVANYKWTKNGAEFFCTYHQQMHSMCCVVKEALICGRVFAHRGYHSSVSCETTWFPPRIEKKINRLNLILNIIKNNKAVKL